jgi:putative PIN family toxin of toxin-antitoxin system
VRIVLDTNVLVSGLLNPAGPPGRILDLVLSGDLELAVDDRILVEYGTVLRRSRFGFDEADIVALLDYIGSTSYHVQAPLLDVRLPDAADVALLEIAVAAAANSLVTGNTRHFAGAPARTRPRIESPADFVRRWRRGRRQR